MFMVTIVHPINLSLLCPLTKHYIQTCLSYHGSYYHLQPVFLKNIIILKGVIEQTSAERSSRHYGLQHLCYAADSPLPLERIKVPSIYQILANQNIPCTRREYMDF